jgi:hypothetical protein
VASVAAADEADEDDDADDAEDAGKDGTASQASTRLGPPGAARRRSNAATTAAPVGDAAEVTAITGPLRRERTGLLWAPNSPSPFGTVADQGTLADGQPTDYRHRRAHRKGPRR